MRLILIRHGETEGNPFSRLQGSVDLPLSEIGRAQAQATAEALKAEEPDRFVTSDMKRAAETARIIADRLGSPVPVVLDSRLREIDLGIWEGMTLDEVRRKFPRELELWLRDPKAPAPEGEPAAAWTKRVSQFSAELLSMKVETVMVVGHLLVFQALISALMEISPATRYPFHLYTGSLSELRIEDGRASLVYLNRLSHLADAGLAVESIKDR
jgi:broad specificity phosphatase PhoE